MSLKYELLVASERIGNEFKGFRGLLPERQGQNLGLAVVCVPCSLDSGSTCVCRVREKPGFRMDLRRAESLFPLDKSGLVFKAHRFLYHSTLGLRVIKKRRR